jgi:signal transduction histidine kinase
MLKLADDVMQISAFDAGKINLHLEEHQLIDLLDNSVQINQYLAAKKGSKLVLTVNHTIRKMQFDWVKIQQVLLNLISNAIKFSPPGSTITITSFNVDGYVVVSVKDPGPGISQEDIGKVFLPFTKGKAKSTGLEPSTGLGLAIAQNIITAHKGTLWVDSTPGIGSVFSFKLPV